MTLNHFHSHHPLSCKEGIISSQTLRQNMIISEDYILQEELNNRIRTLLARTYSPHVIIKSVKKPSSTPTVTCYLNGHHIEKQTFSPLSLLSQTQTNRSQPPPIRTGTQLPMTPRFLLSGHLSLYLQKKKKILAVFTTILSTPHIHMAHRNTIPSSAIYMQLTHVNTPTQQLHYSSLSPW